MAHTTAHPLAGETVYLKDVKTGETTDFTFRIENWWDALGSGSWQNNLDNFACLKYALRSAQNGSIPLDDEVVYGKVDGMGHIMHISELGALVSAK